MRTGGRIDQSSAAVEGERAVPGIRDARAVAEHEEAVALDRHVGRLGRALQAALLQHHVDGADTDAQPDLLRIGAADAAGWRPGPLDGLRELVLERHPSCFVSGGVDIGDIVADDVHTFLMRFDCGNTAVHGL